MKDHERGCVLRPLPEVAMRLLDQYQAPPRLVAHLTLVHEVACTLTEALDRTWPSLQYDREAVRLGAALHDIGKALIPRELTQPGHEHELAGEALLVQWGMTPHLARFARTHARWVDAPDVRIEDLLVALADTWWRGKRDSPLEATLCDQIAQQVGKAEWEVFVALDDIAMAITSEADAWLQWQAQHPAT
jgi:putative nucleotidyltransferase with HDIG domain